MRKIFAICLSTLILSISIFAQSEKTTCPAIQIVASDSEIIPGETISFSAKTENELGKLTPKYEWTVSLGTIIEGQGTSTIKVSTTREMVGANVTAIVAVQGLPDKCLNERSEVYSIAQPPIVEPFIDYGKVAWNIEASYLDIVFNELKNSSGTIAFVRIAATDKSQANNRIKRIVEHANLRKFPRRRLFFVMDESKYQQTFIRTIKDDNELPECENCEIIKGEDVR